MKSAFVLTLFVLSAHLAYADQGSFSNSGGSTEISSSVIITSNVATPAGTLTIDCPITSTGLCSGGTFSSVSSDGLTIVSASFTSGTYKETCWGGGRGRPVVCAYSFVGYLKGTLTLNGTAQAIVGLTNQGFGTSGAAATGTTVYSSAYTPFYFSNTGQILRSDDLNGTNLISITPPATDVGFYGAYGIGLDSAGRIYIADTYHARIVRTDDMNGTNWTSFGAYGSDVGQFSNPMGVSVDSAGEIYVMDTGNSRLVRMDDMNGTNWTIIGSVGSGVGQFTQYSAPVAFDLTGRLYIADAGRIVRMDDVNGTNWTT
jgi:streptogramin lyase